MSRRLLVAGAVAVALAAAGCGDGAKTAVAPEDAPAAYPVVLVPQAGAILDAVDRAVATGTPGRTRAAYGPRVFGPYLDIALAKGVVDNARKIKAVPAPKVQRQRLLVPQASTWPRFFVSVGSAAGRPTPMMRTLVATGPRAQYALWGELTMLPGATVPEVRTGTTGAPLVAPNDASLVATPTDVVAAFAGYLNSNGAKNADRFNRSSFTDEAFARAANDRKELTGKGAATLSTTHTPATAPPYAIRTADGGALVIASLSQRYTVTVKAGRKITVDPALGALAGGKTQIDKAFTRVATEVVAFVVPPRGGGRITVIAAEKGDIRATAT